MDNINQVTRLLIFAEVAQQGSFTKAAAKLKMSKSAVSQHIRKLEDQTGVQVLHRNTRRMTITTAGKNLLSRSAILRDQAERLLKTLSDEEDSPAGLFSVTLPYFLEHDVALPALKQLCIEFPKLELRVEVTDKPLDLIEEGLDVALFGGDLPDSDYRSKWLASVTEKLYVSREYVQQHGHIDSVEALTDHRWLSVHWQDPSWTLQHSQTGQQQLVTLLPFARCNTLSGTIRMLEQGMGFALLPQTIGERLVHERKVIPMLQAYHNKTWQFHFVHPYKSKKPVHVRRFQELVEHYFAHFEGAY